MNGNLITNNIFAIRLNSLRMQAGYDTPKELAMVLCGYEQNEKGLSGDDYKKVDRMRRNISNWENAKSMPSVRVLAEICNLLDCDLDYLIYIEADSPRKEERRIEDITELSNKAVKSLIGLGKYGPTDAHTALELILENELMWEFFQENSTKDTFGGVNVLWQIAQYLCANDDMHELSIKTESGENLSPQKIVIRKGNHISSGETLRMLIDRTHLDALNDSLKELRNLNYGTMQKPTQNRHG